MARPNEQVIIEGAHLIFRNFTGNEGMYNRAGDRNFSILLDDDVADDLSSKGWNVKRLKDREQDEEGDPKNYIQVSVSYKGRPPNIVMITSRGRTNLDEEACGLLDFVDIANVDVILNPYHWNVSGNSGIKAYVASIYVTVIEDYLALKYADVPVIGAPPREYDVIDAVPDRLEIEA